MTVRGAQKAAEAGAAAIVVSNHGGRVLDQTPATAEVLEEIVQAVGSRLTILVDGGIRSGVDVFKALALGADGVLIARPFVTAVYGGGQAGVQAYVDQLAAELADTMVMCGAHSIRELSRDMVRRFPEERYLRFASGRRSLRPPGAIFQAYSNCYSTQPRNVV